MEKLFSKEVIPITLILAAILLKSLYRAYARHEFGILLIYFTLYISAIVIASLTFWRRAWILFLSGIVMGFLFEFFGTRTGLPFGLYYYQDLRPQVLGVALFVPIAWGTFLFLSYLTARSLISGFKAILMASTLMVVLDLAIDPIMTSWKAWVWVTKTKINWYGIPWTNYLGWFMVSLLSLLLYRFFAGRDDLGKIRALKFVPALYLLEMFIFHALATPGLAEPTLYALLIAVLAITVGWMIGFLGDRMKTR